MILYPKLFQYITSSIIVVTWKFRGFVFVGCKHIAINYHFFMCSCEQFSYTSVIVDKGNARLIS